MENVKNASENQLVVTAETTKRATFIGVNGYTNKQGEKSNQRLIGGITYEKCLQKDFKSLNTKRKFVFNKLSKKYPLELVAQAYNELHLSLEKRLSSPEIKEILRLQNDETIMRSDAQIDAYTQIAKGIKYHNENKEFHVFGLVFAKKVLVSIEYKKVNSKDLTICKNEIQKLCNFKQLKYRNFIFKDTEIKMQGETIIAK